MKTSVATVVVLLGVVPTVTAQTGPIPPAPIESDSTGNIRGITSEEAEEARACAENWAAALGVDGQEPTSHVIWLPTTESPGCARAFWRQSGASFLTSGQLLLEDQVFASTLELVSDIVGWFRLGIGVTVASADDDEDSDSAAPDGGEPRETLSRLGNSGGSVQVSATLPILHRTRPAHRSTFRLLWRQIGGTETPASGGFLEDPALTYQSGIESIYTRRGLDDRISFEFGLIARGYWFNDTYAEKAEIDDSLGALVVPRMGFTLLDTTTIDLHWRLLRTDAFDQLGKVAITLYQSVN